MNSYHDPELDDVLQEDELRHIASVLASAQTPEPPLDDAFRTGLRRQLMKEAWAMSEGRERWWRRMFAPPGLAWAGAAAGLLLIAAVVLWNGTNPIGQSTVVFHTNVDGNRSVALQQPILVAFNQPMDHPSTEAAVKITPATTVTFSWSANTLAVQPASGNLAPNTQYKVTIGAGAKTAKGKQLSNAKTITFVTQPPPTPAPQPSPRATPTNALGEKPLTTLAGAATFHGQWSADSSTLYVIDGGGALKVVKASGGAATIIAPDGVTAMSIAPAGDRIAYIRAGKIEVLTFASGQTAELAPAAPPTLVGWAKDRLLWATASAIDTQGSDGGTQQVAALPSSGSVSAVSIAPDGGHAIYSQDGKLFVLDLSSGSSLQLGQGTATFAGWSPDGQDLLYATDDQVVVADTQGVTQTTLARADAAWSAQDAILLGSDTNLSQVRPDGSNMTRLGNGTYHSPLWAPNGTTFAFVRGGSVWIATAPALPPVPSALDDATDAVDSFMNARLKGDTDVAGTHLDDNGKKAYGSGGIKLTISGNPQFSRYYILTSELTSTDPDEALFVVRLVLSTPDKIDVSDYEETLNLVRDPNSKQFVIDAASATQPHDLGKGAQVVSMDVASDSVKVTFDSDLDPGTVADGVTIVDSKGKQVDATVTYANRVVTLSGLNLKEGAQYSLVVRTGVRDVQGQNVSAEYDLGFAGPTTKKHPNHKDVVSPTPSPSAA
jgi:hypothetical protein